MTYPVADHQGLEPSLAINFTHCIEYSGDPLSVDPCILPLVALLPAIQALSSQVASNASDAFQVLTFGSTGSDLTAVIVPTQNVIPSGMSF